MNLTKKLAAAMALLSLSAAPYALAVDVLEVSGLPANVQELKDGAIYYIYDASKIQSDGSTITGYNDNARCAFRYADAASTRIKGHGYNITTSPLPTVVFENPIQHQWIAEKQENGKWKFKNVAFQQYIHDKNLADTGDDITLTYNAIRDAYLVNNGASNWDGDSAPDYYMSLWTDSENASHWYRFFAADDSQTDIQIADYAAVTFNYPFIDGSTQSITGYVQSGKNATEYIPSINKHFAASGLKESNTIVSDANKVFTVEGSWNNIPMCNTVYRITLKPSSNGIKAISYDNATNTVTTNTGNGAELEYNRLWYFHFLRFNNQGEPVMTLHSLYDTTKGLYLEDNNDGHSAILSDTPTELTYVKATEANAGANDFVLSFGNNNNNYTNERSYCVSSWQSSFAISDASFFRLASLTDADYTALATSSTAEEITAARENPTPENIIKLLDNKGVSTHGNLYALIKAKGDMIANFEGMPSEKKSTWESASTTPTTIKEAEYEALLSAYKDLINNCHFMFKHPKAANDWLSQMNGSPRRWAGGTDCRVFTLENTSGTGFYVRNEYLNEYIVHPIKNNFPATFTNNKDDATIYDIDVFSESEKLYGIYSTEPGLANDQKYWHSNGSNELWRWQADRNSSWYITVASEDQAASEYLEGAKAYADAHYNTPGVGNFHLTEASQAAVDAAKALSSDANAAAKRQAGNNIYNAEMALNMPTPGFYRFKGINDAAKYMSSTRDGNKIKMVSDNNETLVETVYYYDGTYLIALADGLVLSKFDSQNQSKWHNVLKSNTDDAGQVTFSESNGKYAIEVDPTNTQRYIYNLNNDVDCGSNPSDDGYRWNISAVTSLPIPGSSNNHTTIYSPVALELKDGVSIMSYTLNENGKVILTKIEGATHVPANTPVILSVDKASARTNGLVYLNIVASDQTVDCGNLGGSIFAETAESTALVLSGVKFSAPYDNILPGFKAYINGDKELTIKSHDVAEQLLSDGKVYTIKNSDTANNRGYLIYDAAHDAIWTSGKNGSVTKLENDDADTESKTNINYHWTFVKDANGNAYLYNLGAEKFAAAYTPKGNNGGQADFVWHFYDVPTAVDVRPYDWESGETVATTIFNILGGQNKGHDRLAGMMVINGNGTHPVPAVAGNSAKDGCGFIFAEVEGAEVPEGLQEKIEAALGEMEAAYAAAKAANYDEHSEVVGYYKGEALTQFIGAFQPAENEETANTENKYYAVARAHNAVANKVYNEFADMEAYQLAVGDQYINATEEEPYWTLGNLDTTNSKLSNWRAEEVNGTLTFTHTLNINVPDEAPAQAKHRAIKMNKVSFAAEPAYDGLGNVKIANIADAKQIRVTSLGSDAEGDKTTAISEISAEGNDAGAIYDLQGRRVNRAAKGIYIVNGKKVLL